MEKIARGFSHRQRALFSASALLIVTLTLVSGCGKKAPVEKPGVSGKVTLDGDDVKGTIEFVDVAIKEAELKKPNREKKYLATLTKEGYMVLDLPEGEYKVLVTRLGGAPPPMAKDQKTMTFPGMDGAGGGGVDPPPHYSDFKTTPLKFKSTGGAQKEDFELKKK